MFKKILIANRGEIACRIISTCKKLSIPTVAVYSDADKKSLHVTLADESVNIGPAASSESYLSIDKIISACKETGADAVHPGYGFLSENYTFMSRLEKDDITFIGPSAEPIRIMGDKIESKIFAKEAGVNTVPGHQGIIKNIDQAILIANEVGFPVMIKASAGGGGKGMRVAFNEGDIPDAFTSSINEAKSSFDDDRVFIEKFIVKPRHIEIQILADSHGNVIHLGERECSIQRRNQKIIEESPSPFVDSDLRNAMGDQAVQLSKKVGYSSAGTVEFIVDQERNFYFLEMNTRLQVEHPVTELVTGFDLVEEMIKVAAGEKLNVTQDDVSFKGWAIESRIYAEDPERNFMPSTGRLITYKPPLNIDNIRNDTGVYEGGEISMFYDPMISKLCSYGKTRIEACNLMQEALNNFEISGIQNNLNLLSSIIKNKKFIDGDISTGFINEEYPEGFCSKVLDPKDGLIFSLAAVFAYIKEKNNSLVSENKNHLLLNEKSLVASINKNIFEFKSYNTLKNIIIEHDGVTISLESNWKPEDNLIKIKVDEKLLTLKIQKSIKGYEIQGFGLTGVVKIRTKIAHNLSVHMIEKVVVKNTKIIKCPMPGLIVSIDVKQGQTVEDGDKLCTVEAMKMENIIRSEESGVIKEVFCKEGDSLAADEVMIEFE
ncbi:acetyl/propionyl/methylcrotonyl-CoA carboxylase subunit alpha [Hyphomicrobiales bacterium]|nr:acetyl/propionyl/methylcrotonyl-CoA carboxylase subunit alpha [Hyphomicrobiales bacterium]